MQSNLKPSSRATVPPPKAAADIVDCIRQRLSAAKDFGDQTTLLCLGIHLLRERQLDQQRAAR